MCVFAVRVHSGRNKDLPNGQALGVKVYEMQSSGPETPAECCAANSTAAARCLLENSSGILKGRLLFAFGAQSNETRGLGSEHRAEVKATHTGNDKGEPTAEANHWCISGRGS